jgi:hypothetical protein
LSSDRPGARQCGIDGNRRRHDDLRSRSSGEYRVRLLCNPGALNTVRAFLVSGGPPHRRFWSGRSTFQGTFQRRDIHRRPGSAPVPVVHPGGPFPDASTNPPTAPVHTFHLGLWFNSPADAAALGCPGTVTPFNGEHNAGIQVLNTSNFPNDFGPLRCLPDRTSCPVFVGSN